MMTTLPNDVELHEMMDLAMDLEKTREIMRANIRARVEVSPTKDRYGNKYITLGILRATLLPTRIKRCRCHGDEPTECPSIKAIIAETCETITVDPYLQVKFDTNAGSV